MASVIRGNSLYCQVNGPMWTSAEANASALGGHLATVSSADENSFLYSFFGSGSLLTHWIGLYRTSDSDSWKWISGSNDPIPNLWSPVEPNGLPGEQQFYVHMWTSNDWGDPGIRDQGTWNDTDNYFGYNPNGIAEIPLTSSITLPTSPKEGAGVFTTTINLSAGTTTNLAIGAKIFWSVTGISEGDLTSGTLTGEGVIDSNGQLQITHSLLDDGIVETEEFKVSVYSDVSRTTEFQIGTTQSVSIVDTGVPFEIGTLTKDDPTIYISGTAGSTGTSKIESVSIVKTVTGTGKNRVTTETPAYTTLATYSNPNGVDGITFNGGASTNTISAAGVSGDPLRPAFNGQAILDGKLGIDTITGGLYRNWLFGGGIFSTPLSTTTTAVDTLIGTAGALDVFDLRTSDFTSDAYSALNSGSARINNYTLGEDWIVLAGAQGSYSFTAVQTTTGSKRNKITTTTGYQIFNGSELVATVNAVSGTTLTGNAATDLQILYGQTSDPTDTLFGGQQLFF